MTIPFASSFTQLSAKLKRYQRKRNWATVIHSGMVRKHQTSDVQLHIGESRDSGFDASHRPGTTACLLSNTSSPSRGALRPSCCKKSFAQLRAWGMPGARCTRSRAWCVVNTRVSHHGCTGSPGIPARNGFNGFLRALLGDRACLSPSPPRSLLLESLTPASGRQDHTTSPSAK